MRKVLTVKRLSELGVLEEMAPCAVERRGDLLFFDGESDCLLRFAEQHWTPDMGAQPMKLAAATWKTYTHVAPRGDAPSQHQSQGLGDTLRRFTDATGLTKLAGLYERVTGKPCGCAERQKKLNEMFPYRHR